MKLKSILVFSILLLLCMSMLSFAQASGWELIFETQRGMPSGWINQLVVHPKDPNTLFAATEGAGFIVSNDEGKTWTPKNQGITAAEEGTVSGYQARCMVLVPSNLKAAYVGMAAFGVFKTTDGGTTWTDINSTLDDTFTKAMVMHPKDTNTLYLGTDGGGIYRYDVSKDEWEEVIDGLKNTYIKDIAMDPNDPKLLYVTTDNGISKTTNGADKWTSISNGVTSRTVYCIEVDPKNPKTLYAGTETGGLFKTTDGGENWVPLGGEIWMAQLSADLFGAPTDDIPETLLVTNLAINPSNSSIIYAANTKGVFRSADAGQTWAQINEGLSSTIIKNITPSNTNPVKVYASTSDGKFYVYTEE